MFRNAIAAAIGSLALAGVAQAGLVSLKTDKTGFTGAVQNISTSTFIDSDLDPVAFPGDSVDQIQILSLNATLSGGGTFATGDLEGRHAVDENGDTDTSGVYIEGGTAALTITFGTGIQAFAFWGVDIGDFDGGTGDPKVLKVELFSGGSMVDFFDLTGSGGGMSNFYGFVGSSTVTFDQVVITNNTAQATSGTDGQGFSRFMVADAKPGGGGGTVPVPGVLALTLLGLAAAGAAGRRR